MIIRDQEFAFEVLFYVEQIQVPSEHVTVVRSPQALTGKQKRVLKFSSLLVQEVRQNSMT